MTSGGPAVTVIAIALANAWLNSKLTRTLQEDREDDASDGEDQGGDAACETPARRPCRAVVSERERVDMLRHLLRHLSGRARLALQLGETRIDAARAVAGVVL